MVTKQFQKERKQEIAILPCEPKGDILHSVQRAFIVLQLIAERPQGLSARDISVLLNLNISTCYHILNTLQVSGYIERHPHSQIYSLGPQIPYLNNAFVQGLAKQEEVEVQDDEVLTSLYTSVAHLSRIRPILYRLTEQTQEPSYMASWSYGEIVLQAIVEAPQVEKITGLYVGYRGQAHSHALGKVLLAYSDPAIVDTYLDQHPLTPFGPNTIVDRSRFIDELNDIVRQGYSIDCEEDVSRYLLYRGPYLCSTGTNCRRPGNLLLAQPIKQTGRMAYHASHTRRQSCPRGITPVSGSPIRQKRIVLLQTTLDCRDKLCRACFTTLVYG